MNFSDFYHPPFLQEWGTWATCDNPDGPMHCFDIISDDDELVSKCLDILNGHTTPHPAFTAKYDRDSQTIEFCGKRVFLIRGWGALTGSGRYHLNTETAARLQDEFGLWTADTLKGKRN